MPAEANARLEIHGQALVQEDGLHVAVGLTNSGDAEASAIRVRAALADDNQMADLPEALAAGASTTLRLTWPVPRAGTHPVLLRLSYHDAGAAQDMQQPAWLLVAVGPPTPPCVSVSLPERVGVTRRASLPLSIASDDGRPHLVRLRFAVADGLRILDAPDRVNVPAKGASRLSVTVLRAGAPVGTTQGLALALTTLDGDQAATTVAATSIAIRARAEWTGRLRVPAVVLGIVLLLVAGWAEFRRPQEVAAALRQGDPG